eukprot:2558049-Rhodomonas_salina.1
MSQPPPTLACPLTLPARYPYVSTGHGGTGHGARYHHSLLRQYRTRRNTSAHFSTGHGVAPYATSVPDSA